MPYKPYKTQKEDFDNQVFSYLMKRLFEDYDESDGCHEGVIDGIGNVIGEPDEKSQWAYTMLDQFMNMLKQNMSQDALRNIFSDYQHMADIDPLFIINKGNRDYSEYLDSLQKVVTTVNDKSYLPEYLYHEDNYVEEEEGLNFSDQVSRALTIATFLLYTLRNDRNLNSLDYNDIQESVECTFNMRPFGDFQSVSEFCKTHGLIDSSKITEEGIRCVVNVAREVAESGILTDNREHKHNHRANWLKLSKVK